MVLCGTFAALYFTTLIILLYLTFPTTTSVTIASSPAVSERAWGNLFDRNLE